MIWPWNRKRTNGPAQQLVLGIAENAALFAQYARKTGGWDLDFSEKSVEILDDMLATLSTKSNQFLEHERAMIVDWGGCYLLEVGRRQFGSMYRLYEQRDWPVLVLGEPEFSAAFLAHDKIDGRLSGDEMDNLPFFYGALRRAVDARRSVLYV